MANTDKTAISNEVEISVRILDKPIKSLVGFAEVTLDTPFGNITIPDFKILEGKNGPFVAMPSKTTTNGAYRDTIEASKPVRGRILEAITERYTQEATHTHAQSIDKQLADGAKQAARENAGRPKGERPAPSNER